MKTINKKILKRLTVILSATAVSTAAVFFSYRHMENQVVPTIGSVQGNKPVIVLDAGHGAYVLSIVILEYGFPYEAYVLSNH